MIRHKIVLALGAAIALQVIVLAGMVAGAAMPLWTGKEVRVATLPVDPRSMFRGNYARLNYAFSTLPDDALDGVRELRAGEVVYVSLESGEDGLHRYAGASLERPDEGVSCGGASSAVARRIVSATGLRRSLPRRRGPCGWNGNSAIAGGGVEGFREWPGGDRGSRPVPGT